MNEIKDSMESGFQIVTSTGVLCEENWRGVRVNIMDTVLHADAIHRGGGQMISVARRVFFAAELVSEPRLQEPYFLAEITAPADEVGGIYSTLSQRRGQVDEENPIEGTPLTIVKAFLPVAESFGFAGHLRSMTAGKAFPNCVFHHWNVITGSPLEAGTKSFEIVTGIRKRKGLKELIPPLDEYMDKL